jgi:hypothetical protein
MADKNASLAPLAILEELEEEKLLRAGPDESHPSPTGEDRDGKQAEEKGDEFPEFESVEDLMDYFEDDNFQRRPVSDNLALLAPPPPPPVMETALEVSKLQIVGMNPNFANEGFHSADHPFPCGSAKPPAITSGRQTRDYPVYYIAQMWEKPGQPPYMVGILKGQNWSQPHPTAIRFPFIAEESREQV